MININPLLITPLCWAYSIFPFTYILGSIINQRFNTKYMPAILNTAISVAFAIANYLQFHSILLAGQLGLWILLSAIAYRIGIEIMKAVILTISMLIIFASAAFIIKSSFGSISSISFKEVSLEIANKNKSNKK